GGNTTTEGGDNTTEGDDTTTEGGDNTTEGDDTTTEGGDNTTEGDDTTTEGGDNTTEGDDTTTEGGDNTTEGDDTTTEGGDNTTEGDDTTTEGGDAEDDSQQTVTLYAKVDADALNVRKGPGTSYTSIDQIYDGATVTVLDRGSSWSKILTEDGVIGYCSNDYLDFYSETGNTTTTITYATITASALCLRKGPGTGYGSMGYIRRGTRVLVEEKGSSWSKVTYDGKTGYMSNAYLSFSYETVEVVTYPYDAYVTASLLNLRTEPTQSSTAVVSIPYRTQVEVIAAAGSWLKINYTTEAGQTHTGYVDSAYISKQQPAEGNNDSTSGGTDSGDAIIDPNASTVQKIVQIALSQVGYTEGRNNDTKYGDALGKSNQPWCLIFVVWCARQAGVDTGVLPAIYSCNAMKNWMAARDRYYTRGSGYVPKPGDLVFLSWSSGGGIEHVGLVWKVEGNTLYTIEGNTSLDNGNEGVKWRTFDLSSGRIVGYGSPAYND
ncbi:MAG: SH3 domain-containing protein, partial [Clostridia bacterium]|nr:SH3 domain-containing protein [Clostridia bacterium]